MINKLSKEKYFKYDSKEVGKMQVPLAFLF